MAGSAAAESVGRFAAFVLVPTAGERLPAFVAHKASSLAWSRTAGALAKRLDIFALATIRHE